MRRIRIGFLSCVAVLILAGQSLPAWGLTSADQAFLKKKIVARWNITGKDQINAAYARGVDILEDHPNPGNGFFNVLVSADELDALRADGYSLDVVDSDWYQSYAAKSVSAYGGFLTWEQAAGWTDSSKLDSFHTAYPSITTAKFSLGSSYESRPLWAIKVSDNPDVDENEPEVLITGIHHAREPISMEVVLHTIRTLLFNYSTDSLITHLVNEREIWFVPFVNPDGYVYNQMIAPSGGGMWRKNRTTANEIDFGIDPNRNYGYNWGYDNFGSSPDPSDETYRGLSAFSELETQHMRDFANSRNLVIAVNFHSYSDLFLWAPGYADFYTPHEQLFQAIGDTVTSFNGYAPEPGWQLYNTNGDSDDWLYFAKGVLAFTPEVGGGSDGFWPNASRIPALVNENIPGNLILIDLADTPERIYPPALPNWTAPDTVYAPAYDLSWSDAGGINAAASFRLTELEGRAVVTDFADNQDNWTLSSFFLSDFHVYSAPESFYGGTGNNLRSRLVAKHYYRPVAGDTLRARMWYGIEADWDYAYAEVSSDFGQSWATLPGNFTTNLNPHGTNRGNGITGSSSGAFREMKFSLTPYVGDDILIRFSYETDGAVLGDGIYIDDIYPAVTFSSEVELAAGTPATTFPISGKAPGSYYYTVRATDVQGQTGGVTPPHVVTVANNTPAGTNVTVELSAGVSLNFDEVTGEGMTTVEQSPSGPPPPSGFTFNGSDYFDFTTTATFAPPLTVCLAYDEGALTGPEANTRLLHYDGSNWIDVTTSVDEVNNIVCGSTSSLSLFVTGEIQCLCSCHADPACDAATTVLDVVETVNVAFRNASDTNDLGCPNSRCDVDCNGSVTVIDVVKVVGVAFRNEDPATNFCVPCAP